MADNNKTNIEKADAIAGYLSALGSLPVGKAATLHWIFIIKSSSTYQKDGFISTIKLDDSNVFFDLTGDGLEEKTAWISGED